VGRRTPTDMGELPAVPLQDYPSISI
jgi:hypothetical protein